MKKLILFLLTLLCLLALCGCSGGDLEFSTGQVMAFSPSPESDAIYPSEPISHTLITTKLGTYGVFSHGINLNSPANVKYRLMRLENGEWKTVAENGNTLRMNTLRLCSNEKGALIVTSLTDKGISFGLFDEATGEFTQTLHRIGSHYNDYICGIDPNRGEAGTVFAIATHKTIDRETVLLSFDVASREISTQTFCKEHFPEAPGALIFDGSSRGHAIIGDDENGKLWYYTLSEDLTVSDPVEIKSEAGKIYFVSAAPDGNGLLHVFCYTEGALRCLAVTPDGVVSEYSLPEFATSASAFTAPDGRVYFVSMSPGTTEGVICRSEDGRWTEELYFDLPGVPNVNYHHGISSTVGSNPEDSLWIVYLAEDRREFVTAEILIN